MPRIGFGTHRQRAPRQVEEITARAREATTQAICDEVIRASIATILPEIVTQATLRAGISAGIWGLGAATSPITYGGSIAAAWVVDLILARAWSDPSGSLFALISSRIEKLHTAILEGDAQSPGLRARCKTMAQEYRQKRRIALHALFMPRADQRTK